MSDEEVQRVSDVLDAIEAIQDPEARSRAQSRVMAQMRERSSRWMKERSELAHRIKQEEGSKASVRGLAKRLGISPSTLQDILDGYRGSGQRRPTVAQRKTAPPPGSDES
ncbi:hypothetical protein ACFRDV_22190 [Streptomyces fagopyri]|uniref:hypothetical protein n=1 Tax=Streptomyces fagopyri TaxID=2662397 RepID=UPI0036B962E8